MVHLPDVRLRAPHQDAIEGITHSMCSLEFENHRPLYNWVIENIFGTEFPKQREFARLNMTNTVMSKRYLRELVEMGIVDGWDDPRMPTLCGLRRRGYPPPPSSPSCGKPVSPSPTTSLICARWKPVSAASWILTAQRRIAVLDPVKLIIDNYPEDKTEYFDIANNPNREANDTTTRKVAFTKRAVDRERGLRRGAASQVQAPDPRRRSPPDGCLYRQVRERGEERGRLHRRHPLHG